MLLASFGNLRLLISSQAIAPDLHSRSVQPSTTDTVRCSAEVVGTVPLTDLSMCNKKSLLDHRTDIVRPISEDRPVWRRVHD